MLNRRSVLRGMSAAMAVASLRTEAATSTIASSDPIKIGQSAVFSGPSARSGSELKEGIDAAFNVVNQKGGIGGRQLQLVALDDGYEPERSLANTRTLVEKEKVVALLGYFGTATSTASMPVFTAAGVPFVGAYSGAGALRAPFNKTVFNVRASYLQEGASIVNHLVSTGRSRIAIFYQDDGFGQSVKESVERAMTANGMKPVAIATVPRNSVDVAAAVKTIQAANANGVVLGCLYAPGAALIKALAANSNTVGFATISAIGLASLLELVGDSAHGLAITQVMPYPMAGAGKLAIQRDYHDAMTAVGNQKFSYGSMEGYVAARVLIEGLRKASPAISRQSLLAGLESMGTFDVGGFEVSYLPNGHNGSSFVEMSVVGRGGVLLH